MDNVAVGPGQGPGSSAAAAAEPAAETAEELAAQLATDDVLREHAQPLLLSVFGEDVMRRLLSKNWKLREEGIMRADLCLSSWGSDRGARQQRAGAGGLDGAALFEAGCSVARLACADKVPQVFFASVPFLRTLLSGADGYVTVPHGSQVQARKLSTGADTAAASIGGVDLDGSLEASTDGTLLGDPVIGSVISALLARAAAAHERTAAEAFQMLMFMATASNLGPLPVARHALAVPEGSAAARWRPLLAQVRITEQLLCEFGLRGAAGLSVGPVMALAVRALSNASVKARQGGMGLAARLAPLYAAANRVDAATTIDAISNAYLGDLKPALQETVCAKMQAALEAAAEGGAASVNAVVEATLQQTPVAAGTPAKKRRGKAKRSKRGTPSKRRGGKERQSGEGEGEGEGEGGELPYAEPLAESLREVAAPVSMLFGQDVARCAFSKEWRPRCAAIQRMASQFKETLARLKGATSAAQAGGEGSDAGSSSSSEVELLVGQLVTCLTAVQPVLDASLVDKVNQVYVTGLRLLKRVLRAVNDVRAASRRLSRQVADNMVAGLRQPLRLVVLRVGDAKTRVRSASEEVVLYTARVPALGPVFAAEAIMSSDAALVVPGGGDAKPTVPAALGQARLKLLARLVHSSGINADRATASRGPGLPLYQVLAFLTRHLQDREQGVRSAATRLLFQVQQLGSDGDFAPVVAAAIAKLPAAVRDRLQDKLDQLAMEEEARQGVAAAVAAAQQQQQRPAPGHGGDQVSPSTRGGVQFSRIDTTVADNAPAQTQSPARQNRLGQGRASPAGPGKASPKPAMRPRTAAKLQRNGRVRGGLFTTTGGAAERSAAAESLPYAAPIPEETMPEVAAMVESLGERVVQCALSKTWSVREASLREVMRQLQLASTKPDPDDADDVAARVAASKSGGKLLPPGSPQVLMAVSTLIERAMQDSVAKVYQLGLHLLLAMVRDYLPTVPGRDFLVRAALQPAVRAAVVRTGDNNERVRRVSMEALLETARAPAVSPSLVGEVVMEVIRDMESGSGGTSLGARLGLLPSLIDEFGMVLDQQGSSAHGTPDPHASSGLRVDEVMEVVLPALENRHLDVRSAATQVYASLYRAVKVGGGDTAPLQQHVTTLRPAIRNSIREAVAAAVGGMDDPVPDSPASSVGSAQLRGPGGGGPNSPSGLLMSPVRSSRPGGMGMGMVRARSHVTLEGRPGLGRSSSHGPGDGMASPMRGSGGPGSPAPFARTSSCRLIAQDEGDLQALFGADTASSIRSEDWRARREGLWLAAEKIANGAVGGASRQAQQLQRSTSVAAKPKPNARAPWHTVMEVVKAALMDGQPQVNIAALDVLQALLSQSSGDVVADAGLGVSGFSLGGGRGAARGSGGASGSISIPWSDWEARLALGSLVKTVVDKTADAHVRVATAASEMASLLAHAHATGWQLVTRHVMQPVTIPQPGDTSDVAAIMKLAKSTRVVLGRLRCLRELLDMQRAEGGGVDGAAGIPLDQVLTFCAAACASTSTLVPHLALSCAIASARQAVAEGGADVGMQAVRAFISSSQAATRNALQPVLDALAGDGSAEAAPAGPVTISAAFDASSVGGSSRGSSRGAGLSIQPLPSPQDGASVGSLYTPKHGRRAVRSGGSGGSAGLASPLGTSPRGSGGFGQSSGFFASASAGTRDADGNDVYTPSALTPSHGRRSGSGGMQRQGSFGRRSGRGPTTPGGTTNPGFSPIRNERAPRDAGPRGAQSPSSGSNEYGGSARRLGRPPASPLGPVGSSGSLSLGSSGRGGSFGRLEVDANEANASAARGRPPLHSGSGPGSASGSGSGYYFAAPS